MSETESKATTKSAKATKADAGETKKRKAKTVAPTAACTLYLSSFASSSPSL
jgi:hypothetical protein